MSYILDALKKADAEREREGVPSLHTQHGHVADAGDRPGRPAAGATAGLPWAVGGMAAGLVLLAGVWWLTSAPTSAPPPEPVPAATRDAPGTAPAQSAAVPDMAANTPPPLAPPAAAPIAAPTPRAEARAVPNTVPSAAPHAAANTVTRSAANAVKNPTLSTSALHVDPSLREAPRRVVPVAELPEDVRRELPALSIGGAMHSDVPANRMLILNGGVFHEGDQPAPGLVLEEIKLKSAVFRFKDHRYSVAY